MQLLFNQLLSISYLLKVGTLLKRFPGDPKRCLKPLLLSEAPSGPMCSTSVQNCARCLTDVYARQTGALSRPSSKELARRADTVKFRCSSMPCILHVSAHTCTRMQAKILLWHVAHMWHVACGMADLSSVCAGIRLP